tara:strand:- start:24 stop:356 length:333 start_codon:yes stop_codon:yes gene_type:complete
MEMIIKKTLPRNRFDPLYKYSNINFIGSNFLVHPDVLVFNAYKYTQKEIAIYYALTSLRNIAQYKATKKITLDLAFCPVELDTITDNRLLRFDDKSIHFIYEEVRQENIH